MNFVLTKLAETALRPSTLIVGAALLGLALILARLPRPGFALLTASLAIQALLFVLPLDQWALAPLENRFPRSVRSRPKSPASSPLAAPSIPP